MKILFLDIDGVVNNATTAQRHRGFIGIDPYMALLVDRIIQATSCKVVLSSTWRMMADSREEVRKMVCAFSDVTPVLHGEIRGFEIQAWLQKHPETTRYAILDDNADMLPDQGPNFFKTSWAMGLTEEIAKQVIEHLNAESYPLPIET